MRFGVFHLAYKTMREAEDGDAVKITWRLVYRDDLGNQLTVAGTEDDFAVAEVGETLPWGMVFRQTQLQEG